MTTTYQLTLTLPGTEADGQLDIFAVLELLPADVAGYAAEWSTPARDITTWQGMAEELAERLLDFEALTLMAQGLVIGHALGHTATSRCSFRHSVTRYLAEMASHDGATAAGLAHHIAKDALGMTAAWGIDA